MTLIAGEGGNKLSIVTNGVRNVLPYERMKEITASKYEEYATPQPYPHIVIDGFFDDWVFDRVFSEFPTP